MRIEHIAIWVSDLERMRAFYERYFNGRSNQKYTNPSKGFSSYFITFDSGARLELMQRNDIGDNPNTPQREFKGYVHLAMAVGDAEQGVVGQTAVDTLTETLRDNGYTILGEPRTTGDGYYESVVLDPEGNRIEITI
ncbi:MAG: VOC family protein [Chloroflexota bacterium]